MNRIKNNIDSLQSLQKDYSDSVELSKTIYINGSSTSSVNQCFSLLNSLKELVYRCKCFCRRRNYSTLIFQPHSTNILLEFSILIFYDGSFSTYGALKLDSVLNFVSSSSITYEIMRTQESTVSTFDGFPNKLLVRAPVLFIRIFYPLFCSIFLCKVFPSVWKVAWITLVFKSGSRNSIMCYRPTSLLPKISLIFEKLLFRSFFFEFKIETSQAVWLSVSKKLCSTTFWLPGMCLSW